MRVTDLTKQNTVLRNIAKGSERMQKFQSEISSGKRITRLSDDPVGATQAEDFRTQISFFGTLQRNIQDNFVWLDRTEAEIAQVGGLLRRAKTLILAQANASADDATRRVTAEELRAITDAIVQSGNSKIGKLFIFSGSKTFTKPLAEGEFISPVVLTFRTPEGETLAQEVPSELGRFEGFSSNNYLVRITKPGPLGQAHYQVSDDGGETWSRDKTLLPQVELVNEGGKPSDKVSLRIAIPEDTETGEPFVFPVGLEMEFKPNPPLTYQGNRDKRNVETSEGTVLPLNVTAEELFFAREGEPDSLNVFDLLFGLERGLLDNDPAMLERRLDDLDLAFNQVLQSRASIGAIRKEIEDRLEKLNDREFAKIRQLSDVEDLDMPETLVAMNLADSRNRAALDTSARLIQPSLLNFLR